MAQASGAAVTITTSVTRVFSSRSDNASGAAKSDVNPASLMYVRVGSGSANPLLVSISWHDGTTTNDIILPGESAYYSGRGGSDTGAIIGMSLQGSGGSATEVIWAVRGK